MIGEMSYDDIRKAAEEISASSQSIRAIADKYEPDLDSIIDFCNSLDNYASFLESNANLYEDSDAALATMIEKNK